MNYYYNIESMLGHDESPQTDENSIKTVQMDGVCRICALHAEMAANPWQKLCVDLVTPFVLFEC